jgi:hypothetical protein
MLVADCYPAILFEEEPSSRAAWYLSWFGYKLAL